MSDSPTPARLLTDEERKLLGELRRNAYRAGDRKTASLAAAATRNELSAKTVDALLEQARTFLELVR